MIFQDWNDISTVISAGIDSVLSAAPLTVKRGNNRGLLTATLSRVNSAADFDGSVTVGGTAGNYIAEAFGYDSRERVAESVSVDAQGVTVRENATYSSSGLPMSSVTQRFAPDGTVEKLAFAYAYDDFERQTSVTTSVNDVGMAKSITVYDGIGRTASVILRDLRGENSETVSYSYLTNGAVKSIATASGSMDMTLKYASGPVPSYSGNISAMDWKGADRVQRSYTYGYDGLNRLISAQYAENERTKRSYIIQLSEPDFSCSYEYDLNGNPTSIVRKGLRVATGSATGTIRVKYEDVDRLTLDYQGNKITKVTDSALRTWYTGAPDFEDGDDSAIEYEYDTNGNMSSDSNRGITGIVYNSLNLPVRVEFSDGSRIENLYDGDGTLKQRRLRQKAAASPSVGGSFPSDSIDNEGFYTQSTDYCGPWEYVNGRLKCIRIPDGYIEGDSVYFHIADHQGNIRRVWNATTAMTVQDNHYYPYGAPFGESVSTLYVKTMARTGNTFNEISTDPYRYSEKEWQPTFGLNLYDFIARQYDPILCRFTTPDPLNGKYPQLSPYLYCAANPINYSDPTGLLWDLSNLSEEDRAKFEAMGSKDYMERRPEIAFLYNFIANATEVFVVKYVDNIVENSADGKEQSAVMSLRPGDAKNEYILSLSNNPPPSDFSFAEDMFHCFQHCNLSGYTDSHNIEYEAQVFACITVTTNAHGVYPDLPFFKSMVSFLGVDYYYYPTDFNQKLNSSEFLSFYMTQSKNFVDYNNKNGKGNSNYRTETKSPPFSLLKFYELFKSNQK